MNEFKEDLKICLMKCGNELKTTTFVFADRQIVKEQMVETLNNVLNSGDVLIFTRMRTLMSLHKIAELHASKLVWFQIKQTYLVPTFRA